jgi:hypothetical protein
MPEQITLIAKAIDCHTLAFAEVFERVVGVERVEVHLEFLPVAGGVQPIGGAAIEVGQLQAVDQAQYLIVGGMGVLHGKIPVDGMLQLGFVDLIGDPRHLADPYPKAQGHDAGIECSLGRSAVVVALLPMLELVQKVAVAVDGGEHLQ